MIFLRSFNPQEFPYKRSDDILKEVSTLKSSTTNVVMIFLRRTSCHQWRHLTSLVYEAGDAREISHRWTCWYCLIVRTFPRRCTCTFVTLSKLLGCDGAHTSLYYGSWAFGARGAIGEPHHTKTWMELNLVPVIMRSNSGKDVGEMNTLVSSSI